MSELSTADLANVGGAKAGADVRYGHAGKEQVLEPVASPLATNSRLSAAGPVARRDDLIVDASAWPP